MEKNSPIEYIVPCVCTGCKIPKGWGEEVIIENNDLYCGKLLIFKKGCKFSMHYHLLKDETWYVQSGKFIYRWINLHNADLKEDVLTPGDIVRQRRGQPHQLEAIEAGTVFEVSTTHFDQDSYRVMKGDSQK
jgi:quercetin dioxygenase-like cupin family protein